MQSISESSFSLPISLASQVGVFGEARVSALPTNLKNFKSLLFPILNFSYSGFCFLFFLIDDSRFEFLTSLL